MPMLVYICHMRKPIASLSALLILSIALLSSCVVAEKMTLQGDYTETKAVPGKSHVEDVMKVLSVLNEEKVWFEAGRGVEPLYFDKNDPMIKALKKAYEDITGDHESEMEVIGGGTYAKAIHNCIAFGADFGGEEVHMHDANEKLNLESVKKQIEIYIEAIKNLNEV